MAKKLKLGGIDLNMPAFDTVEEAYDWANSLDGAQILRDAVYAEYTNNGTTGFTLEF